MRLATSFLLHVLLLLVSLDGMTTTTTIRMIDGFVVTTPPRRCGNVVVVVVVPADASRSRRRGLVHFLSTSAQGSGKTIKDIQKDADSRMKKSIESVKQNLSTIRTGRATANMLDRVKVNYYGVETPLNQMATIAVPSAQQLTVQPYDRKTLNDIQKAITESDLGVTPSNDGILIRINIPPLTETRRKEMIKQCKAIAEEGKVAVRNIRRDAVEAVKKMEKNGDIGKDESKDGQDAMQKLTDGKVKEIDSIVSDKEKDVMKV